MTVANEALRLFLAITALILTAMLTGPADDLKVDKKQNIAAEKPAKTAKYAMRTRR